MELVIHNFRLIIVIINEYVVARGGIEPPTHGFSVSILPCNISDLSPKSVWTSVDISKKCGQSVDKLKGENMEKNEKWLVLD